MQAAKLFAAFREYKRRESLGLVLFHRNRLAALEDSLLGAREELFSLLDGTSGEMGQHIYESCSLLEQEVRLWIHGPSFQVCRIQHLAFTFGIVFFSILFRAPKFLEYKITGAHLSVAIQVSETRQLMEEEELLSLQAINYMQVVLLSNPSSPARICILVLGS